MRIIYLDLEEVYVESGANFVGFISKVGEKIIPAGTLIFPMEAHARGELHRLSLFS